jgi:Protein of unknown function (DUF1572)
VSHGADQTEILSEFGRSFLSEGRQQLAACAGTIRHCATQLDDGQIWWRPRPEMNSIGNLVLHLAANLRQRFLSDIAGEPFERDRFGEFTERRPIPRDELLQSFAEIVGQVDALLARMPATWLGDYRQSMVTAGTIDQTVQGLIIRTLMHLAGHTQEIVCMARLQLGEQYVFQAPSGVPPSMRSGSG